MDPAYGWHGDMLDLDAYLARIGYHDDRVATYEVLQALHYGHVTSIPFENLDALLGVPVRLDLESVQHKLVASRRGGYCYEHVVLFAAALERLGFSVTGLHGRVSRGSTTLRPTTHALLAVRASDDERVWLCDVGFGSGPLEPIELADGHEVSQEGWTFRLESHPAALGTAQWKLYQLGQDDWDDRLTFTLTPHYMTDYAVGNHFVSTHPKSPFAARIYAQSFSAEEHHVLEGTVLSTYTPHGSCSHTTIEPEELRSLLEKCFAIDIDADDAAALTAIGQRQQTAPWQPQSSGSTAAEGLQIGSGGSG
ncbi:arylamine N-acetyltransferase family protein [Streptomyces noursei]|uniref:arylamine N-acetyltransferase family protein n=1 Tax=Streptomyces noursei TaxID=1971 RepID=UPI0028A2BEE6